MGLTRFIDMPLFSDNLHFSCKLDNTEKYLLAIERVISLERFASLDLTTNKRHDYLHTIQKTSQVKVPILYFRCQNLKIF